MSLHTFLLQDRLRAIANNSSLPDRTALINVGNVATNRGDYATARTLQEESLAFRHELGGEADIAASLINLGSVALAEGDYA